MAKKWSKLIARIEALEDAPAAMLTGGSKSSRPAGNNPARVAADHALIG